MKKAKSTTKPDGRGETSSGTARAVELAPMKQRVRDAKAHVKEAKRALKDAKKDLRRAKKHAERKGGADDQPEQTPTGSGPTVVPGPRAARGSRVSKPASVAAKARKSSRPASLLPSLDERTTSAAMEDQP